MSSDREWTKDESDGRTCLARGTLRGAPWAPALRSGIGWLGSLSWGDDAVEAWLRLSGSNVGEIENLGGWLKSVVARVCLNMLQSRKALREETPNVHLPDPIVSVEADTDPEQKRFCGLRGARAAGGADMLAPAERLAFVLHDMFGVPFDQLAPIVGRSEAASRQLASRARRRVHGASAGSDTDLARRREAVDAFMAAAREGGFDALLEVLDPDVKHRADGGTLAVTGSREVPGQLDLAILEDGSSDD